MAHQTPVVGNLALAESWPKFSDTESEPTQAGIVIAEICSTAATGSSTFIARDAPARLPVPLGPEDHQLDFSFSTEGSHPITYVIGQVKAYEGKSVKDPIEIDTVTTGISGIVFSKGMHQIFKATRRDLNCTLRAAFFDQGDWEKSEATKFRTFDLSALTKAWTTDEELDAIRIQVRELFDEFLKWPGSYNQLLLSGSLDYCRSAIKKLRETSPEVKDIILSKIRSYYSQCYGISQQYQEAKTTVRRLNLQSLEDKFELLQEACATAGVYPRLEDLDLTDIPNE